MVGVTAGARAEPGPAAVPAALGDRGVEPAQLSVGGYLQADAVAYSQASEAEVSPEGGPLNQTRFLIRRGRLALRYSHGLAGGALQIDVNTVNGPAARPVNAELFLDWSSSTRSDLGVRGSLGLLKIPFGREVMEASRDRFFLERSNAAEAFFPGVWDLGAKLEARWARSAAGPRGDERRADRRTDLSWPRSQSGQGCRRPGRHRRFSGTLAPGGRRRRVCVGVAFTAGRRPARTRWSGATSTRTAWCRPPRSRPSRAARPSPSASFDRFALGGDARLTVTLPYAGRAGGHGGADLGQQPRPGPRSRRPRGLGPRSARAGPLHRRSPSSSPDTPSWVSGTTTISPTPTRTSASAPIWFRATIGSPPWRWRQPGSTGRRCVSSCNSIATATRSAASRVDCPGRSDGMPSRVRGQLAF